MLQDTAELAAQYLREAIPLMVKHSIPPTPYNYALWYNYVSKRDPILNQAIENALDSHGTCTPEITEELFTQHIIDDHLGASKDLQDSLKSMMLDLQGQVESTIKGTDDFKQILDKSNQDLNKPESLNELPNIITGLLSGTEKISQTTQAFRQHVVEANKEVEQLKLELKRSQRQAQSDALTGLYNRRFLDDYLEKLVKTKEALSSYAVLCDIDHFKSFNDSYGHNVGDQVIKRVASLLKKSVIGAEISARYGGEEFLLVIKATAHETVMQRTEKMRKAIETIVLKDRKQGTQIRRITASFGIAKFNGKEDVTDWVERADKALYQAKNDGRNRVVSAN